jgi:hypothetical protein
LGATISIGSNNLNWEQQSKANLKKHLERAEARSQSSALLSKLFSDELFSNELSSDELPSNFETSTFKDQRFGIRVSDRIHWGQPIH